MSTVAPEITVLASDEVCEKLYRHNVARSRYAHSTRRVKEVPLDDHLDQLAVAEDERPNVEGVLRALGRLPFNQRAALVMRELEGKSYAEIADTLGVSIAAVETLI